MHGLHWNLSGCLLILMGYLISGTLERQFSKGNQHFLRKISLPAMASCWASLRTELPCTDQAKRLVKKMCLFSTQARQHLSRLRFLLLLRYRYSHSKKHVPVFNVTPQTSCHNTCTIIRSLKSKKKNYILCMDVTLYEQSLPQCLPHWWVSRGKQ